ncbi:MAG: multicopper oxidase family protein [Rhodoblastus sp.]
MSLRLSRRAIIGSLAATLVPLRVDAQQEQRAPDGFRILEARKTGLQPAPAQESACFGYDGVAPGPLLRVRQGEDVRVRLVNRLDQPTTLHWQGLRGENAVDGVGNLTQKPVAPGGAFDISFKAADSGIYLYKPSLVPHGAEQIARGMSGVLIVDEADPPEIDRDLIVVMQDFALQANGHFAPFDPAPPEGRIGDHLTANLAAAPLQEAAAPGARLRLRLVNACAARIAVSTFEGAQPFCIAIDGQPCEPFNLVRNSAPVAPGARFDFLLDMPDKEGAEVKLGLWNGQDRPLRPLLAIKAQGAAARPKGPIKPLAVNTRLPPEIRLGEAKKAELVIEPPKTGKGWTINGASMGYSGKPLFSIKRGTPVSFGFQNRSSVAISMHVHGFAMRLLHDLDDGWEPYWRNAVIVPKGVTKHVALLADAPGKWAVCSDIADQEANGLACWFEVV